MGFPIQVKHLVGILAISTSLSNIIINGYCFTFYHYFLGKCKGTVLHFEEDVSSQYLCLRICQKTDKCTWFTFIESLSGCLLLADCDILDETCSDCISGESICKEDSNGINIFSCRYCVFWPVNTCLASSCGFIDPNRKRLFIDKNLINHPYRSVDIRPFDVWIKKTIKKRWSIPREGVIIVCHNYWLLPTYTAKNNIKR